MSSETKPKIAFFIGFDGVFPSPEAAAELNRTISAYENKYDVEIVAIAGRIHVAAWLGHTVSNDRLREMFEQHELKKGLTVLSYPEYSDDGIVEEHLRVANPAAFIIYASSHYYSPNAERGNIIMPDTEEIPDNVLTAADVREGRKLIQRQLTQLRLIPSGGGGERRFSHHPRHFDCSLA